MKKKQIHLTQLTWLRQRFFLAVLSKIVQTHAIHIQTKQGSPLEGFQGVVEGSIAFAPEMWIENARQPFTEQVENGQFIPLGPITTAVEQGIFIPQHLQQSHPLLQSVSDLVSYKHLFTSKPNEKPLYVAGIDGWLASQIEPTRAQLLLGNHFAIKTMPDESTLRQTLNRYTQTMQGLALLWFQPDSLPLEYNLIKLKEDTAHHPRTWSQIVDKSAREACAWKPCPLLKVASRQFFLQYPACCADLTQVFLPENCLMDCLRLGLQQNNNADKMAQYFYQQYPHLWRDWSLSSRATRGIESSL